MWAWLPEELLQRIAHGLIAGKSASELRIVAKLDRRSCAIAQVHLDNMKALLEPPFSLTARNILGGMSVLFMNRRNIQSHHVQLLGAAVASGALSALKELKLYTNQIGDTGLSSLVNAVSNGALASLKTLDLRSNLIGDAGMTAFADAVSIGALDHLTVCWRPTALSPCPVTWHTHSPDPEHLFDVPYAGACA